MPSNYAGSFVNSLDEELIGGINQALLENGSSPCNLPVETVITIEFDDGTTAEFIKWNGAFSDMWRWTGIAHDAQGRRINRDGTLKGASTIGSGGGEGTDVRSGYTFRLIGSGASTCGAIGTVLDSATGILYLHTYSYLPC